MKNNIISVLTELTQLDIDAVNAYQQALKQIDDENIYKNINNFCNDHIRHIDDLSAMIRQYGGKPPEKTPDFKGYILEGFTMIRSLSGTKGALEAMESNEKTTNKNYKNALQENEDFPEDVIGLLRKNYSDEVRHLEYIKMTLEKLKKND